MRHPAPAAGEIDWDAEPFPARTTTNAIRVILLIRNPFLHYVVVIPLNSKHGDKKYSVL